MGTAYERVSVSVVDGVADVRLNRADKMNALDPAMFDALVQTSADLAADASVRVVVLSGNGRAFCAGLDFGGFLAMAGGAADSDVAGGAADSDVAGGAADSDVAGGAADSDGAGGAADSDGAEVPIQASIGRVHDGRITHHGQQAVYGWTELPVPVIAAVHGVALGGGIQLALGADIRIVAPDARMSVLEVRWGLVPDMTGTQRLVELVGLDVAKELTFTGRMVGGAEAVQLGLATQLADDPHTAAMALAAEIAGKSPDAIRAAKRLLRAASKLDEAEGFAIERSEIGALIGSANQIEAVTAWFEKREPAFTDPTY